MINIRYEDKFLIDQKQYLVLKKLFSCVFASDKNSLDAGNYEVRSLYLDNSKDRFFYQKTNGEKEHSKVRLRQYNHDYSVTWLEAKLKVHNKVKKVRYKLNLDFEKVLFHLSNGDVPAYFTHFSHLKPICIVNYLREAYVSHDKQLRVNFDRCPVYERFDKAQIHCHNKNESSLLLEIKYHQNIPHWLASVLSQLKVEKDEFSKYQRARIELSENKLGKTI